MIPSSISISVADLNYSSRINALEYGILETHNQSLAEINEMKKDLEDFWTELSTLSGDPHPQEILDEEETFSFESSVESVVSIQVACFNEGVTYVSKGSGFIYHEHGYILTNYHLVEHEAWGLEVIFNDGTIVEGDLVAYDADYDIALLKVKPHKTLTPVRHRESLWIWWNLNHRCSKSNPADTVDRRTVPHPRDDPVRCRNQSGQLG